VFSWWVLWFGAVMIFMKGGYEVKVQVLVCGMVPDLYIKIQKCS